MKDYYLLIGLNGKEIKILDVNQRGNGLIELDIENRKKKVRCPICNKFTINRWIFVFQKQKNLQLLDR